jgi:hypothetical protein
MLIYLLLLQSNPNKSCWGFVLAYEDTIKYSYYHIKFSLPLENNPAREYIGDVAFRVCLTVCTTCLMLTVADAALHTAHCTLHTALLLCPSCQPHA